MIHNHNKRTMIQRVTDRLWVELCHHLQDCTPVPVSSRGDASAGSVSCSMDWPMACHALSQGIWPSKGFRRRKSVRDVVETLGVVDGLYFSKLIRSMVRDPAELESARTACEWGDPITIPALLARWPWKCSPTSLRYIAHALWLKSTDLTGMGSSVVEIGAGFGGLAAMNAILTGVRTHVVDLPEVISCVETMMGEIHLADFMIRSRDLITDPYTVVSNYAFSELSAELQSRYFDEWIRQSGGGMIISNAGVFAEHIAGMSNHQLLTRLRQSGFHAEIFEEHPVLAPSDTLSGNVLITWRRPIQSQSCN